MAEAGEHSNKGSHVIFKKSMKDGGSIQFNVTPDNCDLFNSFYKSAKLMIRYLNSQISAIPTVPEGLREIEDKLKNAPVQSDEFMKLYFATGVQEPTVPKLRVGDPTLVFGDILCGMRFFLQSLLISPVASFKMRPKKE